jgi:hypothetical protein
MEIGKSSVAFPIRTFHHAIPLLKSFAGIFVARALAKFHNAGRKL